MTTVLAVSLSTFFGALAHAATVDLGEIGADELVGDSLIYFSGDTIDDTWTFTLAESLSTAISVVPNDFAPFFEISDLTVTSSDVAFSFDVLTGAFSFAGLLPSGTYTFMVSGLATGDSGGQYQVLVGATSIPLPVSGFLLGCALLGLIVT
ncbi:MAG: hypothetical protein AAF184_20135, partial [Pseudomonadota bacterium]